MYVHADMGAGKGKPCDGARYNVFHKENGLMRHQLDLDVFMPSVEHRDPQQYSGSQNNTGANNPNTNDTHKGGGARPCGGKFYRAYHAPQAVNAEEKKETTKEKQSTIDAKVAGSGYGGMHDSRAYSPDEAGLVAAAQSVQASHYSSRQQDMSSVDAAVNFNFDAGRYSRIESDMRTAMYAMQQMTPASIVREYSSTETKQEYSKSGYEARYEGRMKKYSGRDIKAIESPIRRAKETEKGKEDAKEAKPKRKLKVMRKRERVGIKAKEKKKTVKKADRKDSIIGKHLKTRKEGKNGIHRRALPSRPEAVRKGPAAGSGKGR